MSQNRAVVFVTDPDFVAPTLLAAMQVKEQIPTGDIADTYIVFTGIEGADERALSALCSEFGIKTTTMPEFHLPPTVSFNPTHVPKSALARFKAVSTLPADVEHIVYMDGDIQILGDIRGLISHTVKPGYIASANDKYWLGNFGRWKSQELYLSRLGVSAADYFNSGVLAFRRDTWEAESIKAVNYFLSNSALCKYHDQSALNVIFKDRREILSPEYNFISDYMLLNLGKTVSPRIIHFTGGLKPWFYNGAPWSPAHSSLYEELYKRIPLTRKFEVRKSNIEQRQMKKLHGRRQLLYNLAMLPAQRRLRFRKYMSETSFAF